VKLRETTCGYGEGVDGINTFGARLSAYWGVGSSVIQSLLHDRIAT
jgi:hypothetical protein